MKFLTRLFRRETSSSEFIPVIDGLRFLAILSVVLFHINGYLMVKAADLSFGGSSWLGNQPPEIFNYGNQGVQLFFVISGFILAVPFMRYYFGISEKKITLKKYFLRRLTRLEPPYILSLLILLILIAFVAGSKYSLGTLILSFFASVFYLHNFIFPGESPYINNVTWSLEVEVQFYLVAPFLVWVLCLLKNNFQRRMSSVLLIIAFAFLGWLLEIYWQIQTISLAGYLQYFLAGILLCDFYLLDQRETKIVKSYAVFAAGFALLAVLICFQLAKSPDLILRILSPLLILGFYTIVFRNYWWHKLFSLNVLTLIGGMCYTIYLFHYQIISAVGRITVGKLFVSNYDLYFLAQTAIFLLAILFFSSVYFLLIEKPCMKKDWYKKGKER